MPFSKELSLDLATQKPFVGFHLNDLPLIDLRGVEECQRRRATRLFSPETIVSDQGAKTEQLRAVLDPAEIAAGLKEVLALLPDFSFQDKFIDVPAAYVGRFAKALAEIGFRVRASDILPYWANQLQVEGIEAKQMAAEKLPRYPKPRFATIGFEAYPLARTIFGFLFFLREAVGTEKGFVSVGSKNSYAFLPDQKTIEEMIQNRTIPDPMLHSFLAFGRVYGLTTRLVQTTNLVFFSHVFDPPTAKETLRKDFLVLLSLSRRFSGTGKLMTVSPIEEATKLRMPPQEWVDSVGRIAYGLMVFWSNPHAIIDGIGEKQVKPILFLPKHPATEQKYFSHLRDAEGKLLSQDLFSRLGRLFWHTT